MIGFLLFYWFVCALIMLGFVLSNENPSISTIENVLVIILSWFIAPIFIGIALHDNSSNIYKIEIKLSKLIDKIDTL